MNPGSEENTSSSNDPLTAAADDATANFWYDNVDNTVVPCQQGVESVPPPQVMSPDKKHWIEIALVDKDGNPVSGEAYSITLPNGSVASGSLNAKGRARVEGIDPGNCKVTFPNLDQHSWNPRG